MADLYDHVIIGSPVELYENTTNTQSTGPQVLTSTSLWDSRLHRTGEAELPYHRIRELQKDPTIAFVREVVVAPAIHTPWTIEATDNAPKEAKELISKIFLHHRTALISSCLLNAMDFGWAPFEVVWEMKKGQAIICKFKQLLHDFTWILVYLDTGAFAGLMNRPTGEAYEILLPEIQSLNVNLEVEGTDWYGKSVMRILDNIDTDWVEVNKSASRYDKKVAGATWVIYYPVGVTAYNGVDTPNHMIAKDLLGRLEASGAVAIPDEIQDWVQDDVDEDTKGKWRIELISATASSERSFSDRLKYLDNLKVRAFGIPERSLLEGKFGTKAEAETHADVGLATIDTKHRKIVKQINLNAVNDVLRVNFGERAENTVFIQVAPLVDSRLSMIRELYRLIIQNPELVMQEFNNMDINAVRDMLGVPSMEAKQVN